MIQAEIKHAAEQYAAKQEVYNPKLKELCIQDFIAGAEANAPKWISVTEQMPNEQTYYLVIANKGAIFMFHWDLDSDGVVKWWYGEDPARPYMQPTHWMKLPVPPSPPNTQP